LLKLRKHTIAITERSSNLFWTKLRLIAALRAPNWTLRRAKRKGVGGRNFRPPSLSDSDFSAAEFRISLCEMRRQNERFCPCPSRPYAGNDKELPKICLLKFILFGSIIIQIITLYTTILPKLYLYDKWKSNQQKYKETTHKTWPNPRWFNQKSGHKIHNTDESRKWNS